MIVHPRVIARLHRLRAMNERIVESRRAFAAGRAQRRYDLMCECPLEACEQMVRIDADAWREACSREGSFVVAHEPVPPLVATGAGDGWIVAEMRRDAQLPN